MKPQNPAGKGQIIRLPGGKLGEQGEPLSSVIRSARWRALGGERALVRRVGGGWGWGHERLLDHGEVSAVGLKQFLLLILA